MAASDQYAPVMNDTKWWELRNAMLETEDTPRWRTRCIDNGYISGWDMEWCYHFTEGGFKDIEWLEIEITSQSQRTLVLRILRYIHVPGEVVDVGFRVYGYVLLGENVQYIA